MRSSPFLGLVFASSLTACAGSGTEGEAKTEPKAKPAPAQPEPAKAEPEAEGDDAAGPSNQPAKTYVQQWATPTGQPTAMLRTIIEGSALVLAGPYVEFGTPSTHLVSIALADGTIEWDYEAEAPIAIAAASTELVAIVVDGPPMTVDLKTGKKVTPKKAQSDADKPLPKRPEHACTPSGNTLECPGWTIEEAGEVSQIRSAGDAICYSTAGAREVRCRAADSGDLELVVDVPAVEGVKHPEAANFEYERVGDQIVVSNYDGTVLAFGPG